MENALGIGGLILSVVVGTVYITREVSDNKSMKEKIEQMETYKQALDHRMDSLTNKIYQNDTLYLARIDSALNKLGELKSLSKTASTHIASAKVELKGMDMDLRKMIDDFNNQQ